MPTTGVSTPCTLDCLPNPSRWLPAQPTPPTSPFVHVHVIRAPDLNFLYLSSKFLEFISPDLSRTSLSGGHAARGRCVACRTLRAVWRDT